MKRSVRLGSLGCLLGAALYSCGAPRSIAEAPSHDPQSFRGNSSSVSGAPASAPPSASVPVAASAAVPVAAPSAAEPQKPMTVSLVRELETPVSHIAVDRAPNVAALSGGAVFVHDAKGWRREELPRSLQGEALATAQIFYGRDYRVRLVGAQVTKDRAISVYLRLLPGGFRPAPDELGQLGRALADPLVAVLGTADPEVVCRPGERCILKRLSGWTDLDAPRDLSLAAIGQGVAWAVAGRQLLRGEKQWLAAAPPGPWEQPRALTVVGGDVWVIGADRPELYQLDGQSWRTVPSVVEGPLALWGASRESLWLVGKSGLAHFDGKTWRVVQGAPPELRTVLGRSDDEVWVGGATGLFRIGGAK